MFLYIQISISFLLHSKVACDNHSFIFIGFFDFLWQYILHFQLEFYGLNLPSIHRYFILIVPIYDYNLTAFRNELSGRDFNVQVSNALDLNMMLCGAALFILLPNLQIP
jgi:hypothetical protein